jgi:hypothetical protein
VTAIAASIRRLRWSSSRRRHPRKRWGRLRLWWADFVLHPLFEIGERCQDCGRTYDWHHVPDARWLAVMGSPRGLLCPRCFAEREDEVAP